MYRHCGFLGYRSIRRTVEQGELNRRNRSGPNSMVDHEIGVDETMRGTRIDKSGERSGYGVGIESEMESRWV